MEKIIFKTKILPLQQKELKNNLYAIGQEQRKKFTG